MAVGDIDTVGSIISLDSVINAIVEFFVRPAFVVTTPNCYGRMIAQTHNLVLHIRHEAFLVIRTCKTRIWTGEPKIVPHHDTIFVTCIIELFIRYTSCPKAYHIKMHILMQAYSGVIIFAMTAQHIFRHTPVAAFAVYLLAIAIDHHRGVLLLIIIGTDAEAGIFCIDDHSVSNNFHTAVIKGLFAIAIWPPQARGFDGEIVE